MFAITIALHLLSLNLLSFIGIHSMCVYVCYQLQIFFNSM